MCDAFTAARESFVCQWISQVLLMKISPFSFSDGNPTERNPKHRPSPFKAPWMESHSLRQSNYPRRLWISQKLEQRYQMEYWKSLHRRRRTSILQETVILPFPSCNFNGQIFRAPGYDSTVRHGGGSGARATKPKQKNCHTIACPCVTRFSDLFLCLRLALREHYNE